MNKAEQAYVERLEKQVSKLKASEKEYIDKIDKLECALNIQHEVDKAVYEAFMSGSDKVLSAKTYTKIVLQVLNGIISNEKKLWAATGLEQGPFELQLGEFQRYLKDHNDERLFATDSERIHDPGNRCKLSPEHAFLLALYYKRTGQPQEVCGCSFGIDQTSVSRYLKFVNAALIETMPIPEKVRNCIASAKTEEQLEEADLMVPTNRDQRELMVDGYQTECDRPQDKDVRKETYSGKKKRYTYNTLVLIAASMLILYMSPTYRGATHDMKITKECIEDMRDIVNIIKKLDRKILKLERKITRLERKIARLEKRCKKCKHCGKCQNCKDRKELKDRRVVLLSDLGFLGIQKLILNVRHKQPNKKKKNSKLTKAQKKENKRTSSRRVTVEHVIWMLKQYKIMRKTHERTPEGFNEEANIVAGLVNLRVLWNIMEPKRIRELFGYKGRYS